MKSLAKRISKAFGVFFLCSVLILLFPLKTYAWEAHLNEDGNIEIYTVDKKRTSDRWYYTDGVTITRCKYDPTSKEIHESKLFFVHQLANAAEILEGSTYYNTFTISIDEIISGAMQMDPAWAKEIQSAIDGSGPAVYIKLDCIMYAVDDKLRKEFGPFANVPGWGGSDGNQKVGVSEEGISMAQLGFDVQKGLDTHFNHYLLIGSGEIQEPQEYPDEHVTDDYTMDHYAGIDVNQPAFAMSNYSSEFDLHDGIPSSEYIDNSFLADSWYGNTSVYARVISQTYTHYITYRWQIDNGYWLPVDTNGDGQIDNNLWISDIVPYSESRLLDIGTGYAAFQYLTDTHVYDFTNADVANGAYPGDHIYYDDSHEVTMTCITTNEYTDIASSGELVTEEPDWTADTKNHASMGTFTYKNEYNFGVVTQKPDIDARAAKDILAIRDIISRNTKTRNDKLVIDGHTFMNNDWVSGCNFLDEVPGSYTQCTQSAAWVNDYMMQSGTRPLHAYDPADVTGTEHVQIPPTVDNGQYPTSMKVFYQRLITYSKTATTFEAD
ncbi:hypothetical protein [Butyrivibrio sp. AC2005]|uniref:hypothetical protein n=1 Tax=Butyrivibrio sp. AC2005 TaxID=1280672 RepID=UPI0004161EEA|nr:hypothetical protein [Butyrivibrio sp. AC2005]